MLTWAIVYLVIHRVPMPVWSIIIAIFMDVIMITSMGPFIIYNKEINHKEKK